MNDSSSLCWQTLGPKAPARAPERESLLGTLLTPALAPGGWLRDLLADRPGSTEPVLLVINDPHRSTQTRPVLAALAAALEHASLDVRFRILVATGTHRFDPAECATFERTTVAGCGLRVEALDWHDATDDARLAEIAGVRMHRWIADSARLLGIGSVEPHYFAGLTGAHKTLTIGCLARADIERNHAGALEPSSDVLCLAGNPVYDGVAAMLAGLRRAGKRLAAINQVVSGECLLAVTAGDPLKALSELAPLVREVYLHEVPAAADVLHLRVPPPLGRNFYQADKALKNNHRAVRDGGGIVLEAECAEGIGTDHFLGLLRRARDYAAARACVARDGYRLGDHKAVKLRHLTDPAQRGVRLVLVSPHVSDDDAALLGATRASSVDAALAHLAGQVTGRFETGLRIEDAGNVSVTAAAASAPA